MTDELDLIYLRADYFRPPENSFWKWSTGLRYIEFLDGTTLCYREELLGWLQHVSELALPPLGTILAIAAASRSNFSETILGKSIVDRGSAAFQLPPSPVYDAATGFLWMVNYLPSTLRSGDAFLHLLTTCFSTPEPEFEVQTSEIEAFAAGELDPQLFAWIHADPESDGEYPWECLARFYHRFGSLEGLANVLRTSLPEPPQPAEVPIPPATLPPEPATLLDELLQDPRTAGVSQLARHLVAALHIPLRSRGSNDMPLGGVSDISNRGKLDRLLLSELAAPDDLLMARLANDEALYLRREEPPVRVERERIVLVDTTLRVWGMPRAFAVAAALACATRNPAGNGLSAYALGGRKHVAADLDAKEGVLQLMERLDAGMHAGGSLHACLAALPKVEKEVILVTTHDLLADKDFAAALAPLLTQLHFIVAVSRSGELTLHELLGGNRKVIAEAKLDIMDLLFNFPRFAQSPKKREIGDLPAFLAMDPSPLFFPATSIRLRPFNCKVLSENSIFVITENGRGLLWQSRQQGALELFQGLSTRPNPQIFFVGDRYCVLDLGRDKTDRQQYLFYDLHTHTRRKLVVEHPAFWKPIALVDGKFHYFRNTDGTYHHWVYDLEQNQSREEVGNESFVHSNDLNRMSHSPIRHSDMKDVINPGYSVLANVKYLRLEKGPLLNADGRALFVDGDQLFWKFASDTSMYQTWSKANSVVPMPQEEASGTPLIMRMASWTSGTQAYCDPRGMLHLKATQQGLPEVTIVMALDQPTAAWASDGTCAGSPYFVGAQNPKRIPADAFVQRYLNPILQTIIASK